MVDTDADYKCHITIIQFVQKNLKTLSHSKYMNKASGSVIRLHEQYTCTASL